MAGLATMVAASALAMLLLARGTVPVLYRDLDTLTVFDVALRPPPPPPPQPATAKQVWRTDKPRTVRTAVGAKAAKPGSHGATVPSPAPPSIVPIEAARPSIIDVGPTPIDHGMAAALATGGIGSGSGEGAGDGSGGGGGTSDELPYFRAEWIRKPTQEELDREWPRGVPPPAQPVVVLLICEVRRSGHPFRCTAIRQTVPGRHFGAVAIRLAEAALVKPVTHGANVADPHVVIPFTFEKRAGAKTSAP